MKTKTPKKTQKTRIVILGAGFGGVYAYKYLHKKFHGRKDIELVVISDRNYFLFTPLLHEVATGNINPENTIEPLRKILGCCLAEFLHTEVKKVQTSRQIVETQNGDVSYDYLISAMGSVSDTTRVPGAGEHALTLKSLEEAIALKNRLIFSFEKADRLYRDNLREQEGGQITKEIENLLRFVVVGGGPTGVELSAEISEFIKETFRKHFPEALVDSSSVILVQSGNELVPQFSEKIRAKSLEALTKKGVEVVFNERASEITKESITLASGRKIDARTIIWTAGVKPTPLEFDKNFEMQKGRIVVNEHLEIPEEKNIFVIGDQGLQKDSKTGEIIPDLAQAATSQAKYVADTIEHILKSQKPEPFSYKHKGTLLSLGRWNAAGEIGKNSFYGRFAWWMWRTIYLSKLISFSKKIKVAIDWSFYLFMPRDISVIFEKEEDK